MNPKLSFRLSRRSSILLFLPLLIALTSGCAILHHVQVGEVDNRNAKVQIPFEILVNEMGVSVEEIGGAARAVKNSGNNAVANVAAIISLFQMGPRTGNPTYNEHFAEKIVYEIYQKCPSGQVTGLMSIREMRKYPAISGEIVKITGYCKKNRAAVDVSQTNKSLSHQGEI
jgi:hypothetical protein